MKFKVFLTKLKFFYLKLLGKIKKINHSVEINRKDKSEINNILLIFPLDEESFRVALYAFRNLKRKKNTNYYYLVNSVYKSHFHLSGYIYDVYYNQRNNQVNIDKYFLNEVSKTKNFEIIVDLNNIKNQSYILRYNSLIIYRNESRLKPQKEMPFPTDQTSERLFNNADSFAMVFDDTWKSYSSIQIESTTNQNEKVELVLDALKEHPFLKENPDQAKKIAEFRIKLLGLK